MTEGPPELAALVERLERVMSPNYVPVWMATPIEALGGEKPVDVIRRGEHERVASLVSELEDPGAA